ncbi:MAG: diaminopimelate decarboxylase [Candidatus Nanohaloarchaea archaeon]
MIKRNEELEIGNLSASEIIEEHGTPLFVYDKQKIIDQFRRLDDAFSSLYNNFSISYAVKANHNPDVVETLLEEGANLDTASRSELLLADKMGVDPDNILYTAPYNKEEEIHYAVEQGVTINLDSVSLLEKMDEVPEELSFRVDPGIGKGDFDLVFAGGTKFGVPEERVVEAYKKAKEMGVERFGLHMMTGSNVRDPEYFGEITDKLMKIAGEVSERLDIEFEFIDIGGGLGIPYRPEEEELNVDETAKNAVKAFKEGIEKYDLGHPELKIEPGRFLVAESGVLLTQVTGVKEKEKTFVGCDTGMHQMIRPMLYNAHHEILLANDLERPNESEKDIVGCVCENDYLARDRPFPNVESGDLLAIMNSGAYGFVMASNWNSRPLPAEIMVEDGEARIIRERQDLEDVFHGTNLGEIE